jgi:hypothetical protein
MRRLFFAAFLGFLATAEVRPVLACKCVGFNSVCERFASADVVFIGKVESMHPDFDPYALAQRLQELFPGRDLDDIDFRSPEAFPKLKALYSELLAGEERAEVLRTASVEQLEATLDKILGEEQRVTFSVEEADKGVENRLQIVDVWNSYLSDCAVQFRKGETYVVYAWNEEGRLRTGACSCTRRLSEAGNELVYLHFLQNGGPDIGRMWGFVSGDELAREVPHVFDYVLLPMADVNVQLRSSQRALQAWTDQKGQYVFDGLPAGDYEIDLPSETRKIHLESRACKSEWFYVPKDKPNK